MATVSHRLIPSLLFIIFTTVINGRSLAQPPTNICPPFHCNDGITIRYPFWNQTHQYHCGYQSFNVLSCNHQNNPPVLLLNLSNHLFHVKTINYSENSLTITYPEYNQPIPTPPNHCPNLHNPTLANILSSNKLFNFTLINKTLRFMYNCILYPPSLPDIYCLRSGSKRSYVFSDTKIPEFDWDRYCETLFALPVNENAINVDVDGDVLVNDFGRFLSEGFKLTWRTPIGACQACEASDGFCGYNDDESFFCICADGRHSSHCGDKGSVSIIFVPNYFHIGELIFGGLLVMAAVFYFVQKKRLALCKPVSRK